jgi:CheY-like chemotaxis protein
MKRCAKIFYMEQSSTGPHILLIEDEKMLANLVSSKLKDKGFTVTIADDGYKGLAAILEDKPDMVLLDMMLPILSGFDILEELRKKNILPDLPLIIISNSGQPIEIERALKLGAMGYVIKLLAIADEANGAIGVRVHPALVPRDHPLASVRDSFNAVFVEAEAVGDLMFYGRGAGSLPTASAVVGDIVDVARGLLSGERPPEHGYRVDKPIRAFDELTVQYYVLLDVVDAPGVLAAVAGAFGENDVSIKSVWQEGTGDLAQLLLITHAAKERNLQATLHALRELPALRDVASVMRVEGGEA